MNRKVMLTACLMTLLAIPLRSMADDDVTPKSIRIGIGTSIGSDLLISGAELVMLPVNLGNLYFPIVFSNNVRLEPEIGFYRMGSSFDGHDSSNSNLRFGLGLFYNWSKDTLNTYFGIRTGLMYNLRTSDSSDSSRTDLYIGPALGTEYLFSKHFSLGVEAQLLYIDLGNWETDGLSSGSSSESSIISTRALVFARVYF